MAGSRYGDGAEISGSLGVTGSATFNDESKDVDFRIESDDEENIFFVDASTDKIGIGTNSPTEQLQVKGTVRILKNNNAQGAKAKFILAKSRGTEGSPTVLNNGDSIGVIEFNGYDGDEYLTAADITCKVDAAAGDGDMAGAIYFSTTADSEDTPTDRMVIDSAGMVGIGTTSPKVPLDIYEMGGLIIGYTMLNNNDAASNASYQLTTSYAVPTSNWKITFKAPASGKVEIQFLGYLASAASGNDYVYLGLSDNSTYNSLGSKYERQVLEPDEDDNIMLTHSWYVSGLTAGTTYTYYVGTKGTSTAHYWFYGGTNSNENPPIIIRAVSLPNTVHTD